MKYQIRNRTKLEDISYALHLYFNGLSLRNTTKALSRFVHRSHIAKEIEFKNTNPKDYFAGKQIL
jgi:hypothetical protein